MKTITKIMQLMFGNSRGFLYLSPDDTGGGGNTEAAKAEAAKVEAAKLEKEKADKEAAEAAKNAPPPTPIDTDKIKAEAAEAERKKVLAELGIEDIETGKTRITKAKELEDANKSELEKANEKATVAEKKASEAEAMLANITDINAIQTAALNHGVVNDIPTAVLKFQAERKINKGIKPDDYFKTIMEVDKNKAFFGGVPAKKKDPATTGPGDTPPKDDNDDKDKPDYLKKGFDAMTAPKEDFEKAKRDAGIA